MEKLSYQMMLSLVLLSHVVVLATKHEVYSSLNNENSNRILKHYVRESEKYFVSNSIFFFHLGKHDLNVTLNLKNVSNVTFIGTNSSVITMTANGHISCTNATNIVLYSLKLESQKPRIAKKTIYVFNSSNITLSKVVYHGNQSTRAAEIYTSAVVFHNCSFHNGHDRKGGALYIRQSNIILCGNNSFLSNTAIYGGAIYAERSTILFSDINMKIKPMIHGAQNSMFENNNMSFVYSGSTMFNYNNAYIQGGAILITLSNLTIKSDIKFINNNAYYGGGLYARHDSKINYQAKIIFYNNSAKADGGGSFIYNSAMITTGLLNYTSNIAGQGGGLFIFGRSSLKLTLPLQLIFKKNVASNYGGAIYQIFWRTMRKCFISINSIHYPFNSTIIHFLNNSAMIAGSALSVKDLDNCNVTINGQNVSGYDFFHKISAFNENYSTTYIFSETTTLYFCKNCDILNKAFTIPPGKMFNISIAGKGANNKLIPSKIDNSFINNADTELHQIRQYTNYLTTEANCYDITFVYYSQKPFSFRLYLSEKTTAKALLIFVHVDNCPPGFEVIDKRCTCEKGINELYLSANTDHCDINTGLIERPSTDWIEPITDNSSYLGFKWSPNCQALFCKEENRSHPIRLDFSSSKNNICKENRTGILCGTCVPNYSLRLGSLDCALCEDRYISLLLVFMAAGIVLVALLLLLNINVSTGTINGLILYANLVNIRKGKFFSQNKSSLQKILHVIISWINLDLGISTCFYNKLNGYSYSWLQFIFPLYLWVLTVLIILSSKYSKCIRKLLGSNPIAMLATIILLSYTKLIQLSQDILSSVTITLFLKNGSNRTMKYWKFDPSFEYLKGRHIAISVSAMCTLILLVVPYTLLLLFGYQLQAFSNKRICRWINKLKPLLDAYYAPYTSRYRYWPGLLLIARVAILVSNSANVGKESEGVLVAQCFVLTSLCFLPWLCGDIYEKRYLNILEASFLLNNIILAGGTYWIKHDGYKQRFLTSFLVGIAMIQMTGIIIFHIICRIPNKYKGQMRELVATIMKTRKKNTPDIEKRPTAAILVLNDLREPLLEDSP